MVQKKYSHTVDRSVNSIKYGGSMGRSQSSSQLQSSVGGICRNELANDWCPKRDRV